MFAHRGASGYAPENTLESFRKAVELNANAIELDVQLTKDGKIVVIHDYTLDRTTNGNGYVMENTLAEIKKLDAGSWFSSKFAGEKIPTLKEVIDELPEDIYINIEIKHFRLEERNIGKAIVEFVEKYGLEERIIISSFDHQLLKKVRIENEKIRIGVLFYGKLHNIVSYISQTNLDPYSVHLPVDYLDKVLIQELKEKGYRVLSYTVNEKRVLEEYPMLDGYYTDFPNSL